MSTPARCATALLVFLLASGCSPRATPPEPTAPDAPGSVTATAGVRQASVSWLAPSNDGGSAITGYRVTSSPDERTVTTTGATAAVVTGLTSGVSYTFTVTAMNAMGTGPASAPSNAIVPTAEPTFPGAPSEVVAVAGDTVAHVVWSAPLTNGGSEITGYIVTSNPGGLTASTTGATAATVTGLTNGRSYTFTVVAANDIGTGRVSTHSNAVVPTAEPTVPGAPSEVVAVAGDAVAHVEWNPPSSNGGSELTGYTVTSNPGGLTASTTGATSATVTGLTNGISYTFIVVATNDIGTGPASDPSAPVVPTAARTVPEAPSEVVATAGDAVAHVEWNAPSSSGGTAITGYTVTSSPDGLTASTTGATSATVTGLANGMAYTFTVTAANEEGTGPASAPSNAVTPATIPDAPSAVTAVAGDSEATVSWTPPGSDGGSEITGYLVTSSPDGMTASTTGATSAVISGLTNGVAYTFTVTATNARGTGPSSEPSSAATPAAAPGAPTDVIAAAGVARATVHWTAPEEDGGSAITGYTVTAHPGGLTASTTGATSATVFGLTNGVAYTFTVAATNAISTGPASIASNEVTPEGAPGAPTEVTAIAGDAEATVHWTAPSNDGGSVITGYTVTSNPDHRTATGATGTTVTGLRNGQSYIFTVTATNATGTSPASKPSNAVVPRGPPTAPRNVGAVSAESRIAVEWDPPSNDGGSPITTYTVTSTPAGITLDTSATHVEFAEGGGTSYTFQVTATTSIGTSPPSAPSNAVMARAGGCLGTPLMGAPQQVTGGSSHWIAHADLNGDGVRDLVTTGDPFLVGPSISVLLGRDGGLFAPAVPYVAGTAPRGVTTGDFDGDGILDLAVADEDGDYVSVLVGVGDGTFGSASNTATDNGPRALVRADFNADGKLDLATANWAGTVSVLLGAGDGSFLAAANYPGGTAPSALETGDFNADGRPDLVVSDRIGASVNVLLGDGDGTFEAAITTSVGANPSSLALGDFDGDGKLDLATANAASSDVAVLLGTGDGGFATAVILPSGGTGTGGIDTGDFDGDGVLDLVTTNVDSNTSSFLKGVGDGTFAGPATADSGVRPVNLIPADLNEDGVLDLAVLSAESFAPSAVTLLLGTGTGSFHVTATYAAGVGPTGVSTADFDRDGHLDLAVSSADDKLNILLGNGDGRFLAPVQLGAGVRPVRTATSDFNDDGSPDVVIASSRGLGVFLGDGSGGFAAEVQYPTGGVNDVVVGDFDADGAKDLAAPVSCTFCSAGHFVKVLLGAGDGTFGEVSSFMALPGGYGETASVRTADLNGDGHLDLVTANGRVDNISVMLGAGDGTFPDHVTYGAGDRPNSLAIADFNGDGNQDVATANRGSDDISVLLGMGDGTFGPAAHQGPAGTNPFGIVAGDLNDDGAVDLVTANHDSASVSLFMGRGNGSFSATTRGVATLGVRSVAPGDFDGDGDLDLASAGYSVGEGEVNVFLSRSCSPR